MDAKLLRKQIKNVLQETAADIVASEVGASVEKNLLAELNARLDSIDKYCQQAIEKMDKRAKNVQAFLVQTVQGQIQNDLFNANVTIDAVVAVLAKSGINIPDFAALVDVEKTRIAAEHTQKASDAMKAEMEAGAALANKPAEASQPTA